MKRAWPLAFAITVVLVAGCSHTSVTSSSPYTSLSPSSGSSTYPIPSGSATSTSSASASGSPGPTKPATPPPSPGTMRGASTAKITGPNGINIDLDFNTMDPYSFYGGPEGQSSLVFTDSVLGQPRGTLTLGGFIKKGTYKTSPQLGLSIWVTGHPPIDPLTVASGDGSCRVTIDMATSFRTTSSFKGSFRCNGVAISHSTSVNAAGTFSGVAPSGG